MPANNKLHCLIYGSSASEELTPEKLTEVLIKSRKGNTELNVTGMLLYSDGNIIQVLEGAKDTIEGFYNHIQKDHRHTGIIRILDKEIERRSFCEWSMGFREIKTDEEGFKNLRRDDFLNKESVKHESILNILKTFVENNS